MENLLADGLSPERGDDESGDGREHEPEAVVAPGEPMFRIECEWHRAPVCEVYHATRAGVGAPGIISRLKAKWLASSPGARIIAVMPNESTQAMLELATRLAQEAADMGRKYLGRTTVSRKADASVVTEADRAIESHILGSIGEAYPDHAICAEESASDPDPDRAQARFCWVIDPIDGTRNYVAGFPGYCTSIAVLDRGRSVVGVVLNHNGGDLYLATAGGGSTLNGREIHVGEVEAGDDFLVGVPSSKDALTVAVVCSWIATPGMICRNIGSTALHMSMVAAGQLGGGYCKRCKIWDVAAGVLLVEEAGGRVTTLQGEPLLPFDLAIDPGADVPHLAAAPGTHEQLLERVRAIAR